MPQQQRVPVMIAYTLYPPIRWSLSALWLSSALLIFMTVGSWSVVSWMALAVAAVIPPVVFLILWNNRTTADDRGSAARDRGSEMAHEGRLASNTTLLPHAARR